LYSADGAQGKILEGSDEQQISNTLFLRSLEEIFSASLIALRYFSLSCPFLFLIIATWFSSVLITVSVCNRRMIHNDRDIETCENNRLENHGESNQSLHFWIEIPLEMDLW